MRSCRAGRIVQNLSPDLPLVRRSRTTNDMDKFEEIFRMQAALNSRIGVNLPPGTDEEKAKWILNYSRALQQETAELIDSVPWKWWAKYQKFDEQNAKVEVVDLFHFLVSLAQTLGMSAEDVYQAYVKKNAVNHQRQDSGYVKKDAEDASTSTYGSSRKTGAWRRLSNRHHSRTHTPTTSNTNTMNAPVTAALI
jgi:dimeric dUTPase (all-alpha-NTP-PPase superfamily)